ncbi:DALR domain-containing protein, partial [Chloroflexota bacterium]
LTYLGQTLDIHGGGQDLVFPHHENEIAQTESFTGVKPFVKYWLHNGLVHLGEEKMSKSLGNLITIKDALGKYGADALRIFVLSSHYRSPLTYSEEVIGAAERGAERLRQAAQTESWETEASDSGKATVRLDTRQYRKRFTDAMDDDFGTPQALAALFDLAREINQLGHDGYGAVKEKELLKELGGILGLRLEADSEEIDPELQQRVDRLIEERARCRQEKNWRRADEIRDEISSLGATLEDTPRGTIAVWKKKQL